VAPQISSGQLTFQYLPKAATATMAMLTFQFDALGDTGLIYGTGTATVTLAAGAVSVTITLTQSPGTSKGLGATCTAATDCGSGSCTDGVCCQEACKDVCASCALTNTKGLCVAYAANTDPENECAGFSMATGTGGSGGKGGAAGAGGAGGNPDAAFPMDASASDAEPINAPDGGIMATASTCGGTCNGLKQCAFASPGTSCGKPFCNTRKDLANLVCDGKGSCGVGLQNCTSGYACDFQGKDCRTSCSANLECLSGYYCNGTTNACAATKADGLTCATDAECTSNHCVVAGGTGVCCNTACSSPNSCNNSGFAGKCQCPGVTCAAGVACQIFYQDADGDGYGNKNGVLGTTAKAGCAGVAPSGFVADNTDCDDGDANVHPGQTGYFGTVSKGTGTFDYDCDGTPTKEFPEYPGASCTFCPSCSAGCATGATSCSASGAQASLACPLEGGICLSTIQPAQTQVLMSVVPAATTVIGPPIIIKTACCGCNDHAGFNAAVACGQSGAYVTCGTCGASGVGVGASGGAVNSSVSKQQLCR
jgi:hypothetical protein